MLIKRKKDARIYPRDKFQFFRENPKLWNELKDGKTVEIPDDLFSELRGVEKVAAKQEHKEGKKV